MKVELKGSELHGCVDILTWITNFFYLCGQARLRSIYRNDPKFSDRQVWANSADPYQTALKGAVSSGSSLFAITFASF